MHPMMMSTLHSETISFWMTYVKYVEEVVAFIKITKLCSGVGVCVQNPQ